MLYFVLSFSFATCRSIDISPDAFRFFAALRVFCCRLLMLRRCFFFYAYRCLFFTPVSLRHYIFHFADYAYAIDAFALICRFSLLDFLLHFYAFAAGDIFFASNTSSLSFHVISFDIFSSLSRFFFFFQVSPLFLLLYRLFLDFIFLHAFMII